MVLHANPWLKIPDSDATLVSVQNGMVGTYKTLPTLGVPEVAEEQRDFQCIGNPTRAEMALELVMIRYE